VSRPLSWTLGVVAALGACAPAPDRGATVLYASGADLQSINPLLTVHPLARQVQRYVLLTTLARYDSALVPRPYLARGWSWSADRKALRFQLVPGVRWDDGATTTARDVRWTLEAARDPVVGYPRLTDLADLDSVSAPDDSTVVLGFSTPQARFPDVLTDLAILPAHLLDSVPRQALRRAEWNQRPVGNGPFRFVRHEANRRWVFAANPDFPAALGGPPGFARLVLAVVDEPVTKLAALVDGELDFAGIQPAHAAYVRRDPRLRVLDYPLLFTYGLVFNARRIPFDRVEVRRRISDALDRRELVEGYVYGYGTPATGPVPPGVAARPAAFRPAPRRDFELLTVGSGEGALEQMVQAQLARAGFRVTIRQLELSAFLDRLYGPAHDFDAAILGIPGDLGLGYLGPLAALAGMTAPRDPVAAERMFADSMPVAFLYHARGLQGMNRRVHGVRMDVRGELVTVHDWRVEP
jgi:peptide/nickel transport system substrate-binding protein